MTQYERCISNKLSVIMASIDSYYNEIIEEIQRQHDEELRKMMPDIRQIIDGHRDRGQGKGRDGRSKEVCEKKSEN